MEELQNDPEAGAGAEIREQKKIIAKKFGNKIRNINFISKGEEGNIYSFIDKDKKNKIVKIFSNNISKRKKFEKIKEDLEKQESLVEDTKKTLKVLEHGKINYKNSEIFYQIYHFMETDLSNAVYDKKLDPFESFMVALRSIIGVCSLHKAGIAHRDIKLENIMVNLKNKETKIIDFGFSEKIKENTIYDLKGTVEYTAPELFDFYELGIVKDSVIFPADIYALGIVLFTLITKDNTLCNICTNLRAKMGNNNNITKSYINFIQNKKLEYLEFIKTNQQNKFFLYETPEIRERFFNLIKQMIDSDYKKRPSIEKVLDEMIQIYSNIKQIHKNTGFLKKYKGNIELKSREKILIRNYIGKDKITIEKKDVKNIENKTLKKIKNILENKNITNNLKRHIKINVNNIYNDDIFKDIKNENLAVLSNKEETKLRKIKNLLIDTKLAYCYYCADEEKRKQVEISKEFIIKENNLLCNLKDINNSLKDCVGMG